MEKNIFGKRLKELRYEKNLSQIELAKNLNIGKTSISEWEIGKKEPVLSNARKIADFFDVSLDYLAGRKEY